MSAEVEVVTTSLNSIKGPENGEARQKRTQRRVQQEAWLQAHGWKLYGRGAFKATWVHPDSPFVVKTFADGGVNEVRNYEKAPEHVKPYLLPILRHGEGWMMQRKVVIEFADDYAGDWDKRKDLCKAYGCTGSLPGVCDSGPNNHMHRPNGRLVIFDYGQEQPWYDYGTKAASKKRFLELVEGMHPKEA